MTQGRSPYMTTTEVAHHLRFVDAHGAANLKGTRAWLYQHPEIRRVRRGATVLVHRDDVDEALVPVVTVKARAVRHSDSLSVAPGRNLRESPGETSREGGAR